MQRGIKNSYWNSRREVEVRGNPFSRKVRDQLGDRLVSHCRIGAFSAIILTDDVLLARHYEFELIDELGAITPDSKYWDVNRRDRNRQIEAALARIKPSHPYHDQMVQEARRELEFNQQPARVAQL